MEYPSGLSANLQASNPLKSSFQRVASRISRELNNLPEGKSCEVILEQAISDLLEVRREFLKIKGL